MSPVFKVIYNIIVSPLHQFSKYTGSNSKRVLIFSALSIPVGFIPKRLLRLPYVRLSIYKKHALNVLAAIQKHGRKIIQGIIYADFLYIK